jgi:hypothetical protein
LGGHWRGQGGHWVDIEMPQRPPNFLFIFNTNLQYNTIIYIIIILGGHGGVDIDLHTKTWCEIYSVHIGGGKACQCPPKKAILYIIAIECKTISKNDSNLGGRWTKSMSTQCPPSPFNVHPQKFKYRF